MIVPNLAQSNSLHMASKYCLTIFHMTTALQASRILYLEILLSSLKHPALDFVILKALPVRKPHLGAGRGKK
jgi:hypothetical protein